MALEIKEFDEKPRLKEIITEYDAKNEKIASINILPTKNGGWVAFIFLNNSGDWQNLKSVISSINPCKDT